MSVENCFLCNGNLADTTNPLIILMQKKEKVNKIKYREYREIPVPVCAQCLERIKKRSLGAEKIGGIIFLLFVILGFILGIIGMLNSPNEKSPINSLFVIVIIFSIIGLFICLMIIRLSVPISIRHYISMNGFKNGGWRISPYAPIKNDWKNN